MCSAINSDVAVFNGAGHTVKQSEAVMLSYPLMWGSLSNSTIESNLRLYSNILPHSAPSTAWAMLTINWLALGESERAQQTFEKSYKSYVSGPYKVCSRNNLELLVANIA